MLHGMEESFKIGDEIEVEFAELNEITSTVTEEKVMKAS